jgi:hypothetical protein
MYNSRVAVPHLSIPSQEEIERGRMGHDQDNSRHTGGPNTQQQEPQDRWLHLRCRHIRGRSGRGHLSAGACRRPVDP